MKHLKKKNIEEGKLYLKKKNCKSALSALNLLAQNKESKTLKANKSRQTNYTEKKQVNFRQTKIQKYADKVLPDISNSNEES